MVGSVHNLYVEYLWLKDVFNFFLKERQGKALDVFTCHFLLFSHRSPFYEKHNTLAVSDSE